MLEAFLLAATAAFLVLGSLVQFKAYSRTLRLPVLGLSVLFAAHLWVARASVSAISPEAVFALQKVMTGLGLAEALCLLGLCQAFLRGDKGWPDWMVGNLRLPSFIVVSAGVAAGEVLLFTPGLAEPIQGAPNGLVFQGAGMAIPGVWILLSIYSLYVLENTYRFAEDFQRRIGRLCFIGLGAISLFHVVTLARVLLFHGLPPYFAEASSVIYGVTYPVVLLGFLRYRLGVEYITIPRNTLYSSIIVFLTGATFLGVAVTVYVSRRIGFTFEFFEGFLVAFTMCFLAVMVLGSGTMRRRIIRFADKQFYSRKYDYQEQFFRLHKASLSGAEVDTAVVELVENMKYGVTVDDAHFFLLNWQDGDFYQRDNKEEATRRGLVLSGDGPLARHLAATRLPVDLLDRSELRSGAREAMRAERLAAELQLDAVFPIIVGDRLGGILALKGGRDRAFDAEDLALIGVFTSAIGDALFKNMVLKERIEQKQFESFHHVASFIIHDIKNQIATLNLLMNNAERNLANPSFQASMKHSIRSCAVNLQALIDRLAVGPRSHEKARVEVAALQPVLEEVVANAGLASLTGLELDFRPDGGTEAAMDRQALFFVVRNLINNALEAMGGKGRLALTCGSLSGGAPGRLRELFGGGERFFASYGAWILVEDSGPGMDPGFVRERLFQPFATTKEKGVGIGLYQCKTLVEKMGGRILCHSAPARGTEFCILLPGAKAA